MKKSKLFKILPFIIVLIVSAILLLTEILSINPIMANDSMGAEKNTNTLELIPFFWTVGIVGGCIGLTLAYVSWRKYRAEEKKKDEMKKKSHS